MTRFSSLDVATASSLSHHSRLDTPTERFIPLQRLLPHTSPARDARLLTLPQFTEDPRRDRKQRRPGGQGQVDALGRMLEPDKTRGPGPHLTDLHAAHSRPAPPDGGARLTPAWQYQLEFLEPEPHRDMQTRWPHPPPQRHFRSSPSCTIAPNCGHDLPKDMHAPAAF
jgi:hypothetical protein